MDSQRAHFNSPIVAALAGSALIGAQYVAGKVVRDALFLDAFDGRTALPWMTAVTSLFAIGLVVVTSKGSKRFPPSTYVPAAFGINAVLLTGCWVLAPVAPKWAAVMVYLLVSGLGPILGSGFWLLTSERLDPRTGKRRFGQIAGAGTLGGLLTAFAPIPTAAAMLPVMAGLNVFCAWQVRRLARSSGTAPVARGMPHKAEPPVSGLGVLARARYLRSLAILVLLGTIGAVVVDYLFKTHVAAVYGGEKLQFFQIYYPAVNTATFIAQTFVSRLALEKLGLAVVTSLPSFALFAGSITSLLIPGVRNVVAVRAAESIFRGSLYRTGYELFFTPMPPREKRAVKSVIDVGFDRFGDFIGAGLIQGVLLFPAGQSTALVVLVLTCSGVGLFIASRLSRGYVHTLEQSLLNRAVELDLSDVQDLTTRTAVLKTLRRSAAGAVGGHDALEATHPREARLPAPTPGAVQMLEEIAALGSHDRNQVLRVLGREHGLAAPLVPHVIPLLAWDSVGQDCIRALRSVAEERVGELTDALVDPNQPFPVRRRLARVFSVCVSQRAADGLMLGLDDLRFEVRFQCGRSLLAILEKNPGVRLDKERVFGIVEREVAVSGDVWKSRRLLDGPDEGDSRSFLEELVRDRASQSLAHVFTLLAIVLPTEPMRIAFRGLHTNDQNLRGTALEYLESQLPPSIRPHLWRFLEDERPATPRPARPGDDVLADLLRSNQSIMLNLQALQRRAGAASADAEPGAVPR
jgi:hypothetical protein